MKLYFKVSNVCADVTCFNGGNCVDGPDDKFKCMCPHMFNGPNCESKYLFRISKRN